MTSPSWGVPGLTFMSRYARRQRQVASHDGEGKEWERDSEIKYVQKPNNSKTTRACATTSDSNFARAR
ncbi:OprD family outer membrane porin [Pseudomonas sp. GG8]